MDQDHALRKVLKTRSKADLPYDFESRLMKRILLVAKKKQKRSYVLSMILVSSVSLSMIVGILLVLKKYASVHLSLSMPSSPFTADQKPLLGFYLYISLLVLVLLGLDAWLRKKRQKSEKV